MVWSAGAVHAEQLLKLSPENLCTTVMSAALGLIQQRTGSLKMTTPPKSYPLRKMKAERIIAPDHRPRIVLIGDAAHAMHPLAGQGLNLGLRDVATLGQLFENKESFRDIDDPVVLRRYERARHGDTDALLFTTDQLQKLFANQSDFIKTARNFGMNLVNRSQFLKRQLIQKALS